MTDHAQRAKDVEDYIQKEADRWLSSSQRSIAIVESLSLKAMLRAVYAQAHAAGRRAGLEEAARMLDRVAAIAASLLDGLQCDHTVGVCCCDDRRTIREAVNLTRAKAKEGV